MSLSKLSKNQALIASALGSTSVAGNTKSMILEAYIKIAVREGSTALSLTRLAEELKISKQLVRYHVSDLDQAALELFTMIATSGAHYIRQELEKCRDWKEELFVWHQANFDWFVAYPDFGKFLLFMYHRASVDPETRILHEKIVSTGRQRIKKILKNSSQKSILKNAETLSMMMHRSLTAALIEMFSCDDIKNHAEYRKSLKSSFDYLLNHA